VVGDVVGGGCAVVVGGWVGGISVVVVGNVGRGGKGICEVVTADGVGWVAAVEASSGIPSPTAAAAVAISAARVFIGRYSGRHGSRADAQRLPGL